jgi:hypothetical protein
MKDGAGRIMSMDLYAHPIMKKLEIRKRTQQSHLRREKKSNKRYIMLGRCL